METTNRRTYRFIIGATLLTTMCFSQIQKDKFYHFGAGIISEYMGERFGVKTPVATSFVVGFAKETYDYIDYGKFDTNDLIATAVGGLAYSVTITLVNNKKNEKINNKLVRSYRKHKRKLAKKRK